MENNNKKVEKFLGIDFGLKNIGLAISQGFLAEPLTTLKVKDDKEALDRIHQIIKDKGINKVIIGVSEKAMVAKTRDFVRKLEKAIRLPIILWDETLTSFEACQKMIQAKKQKKKRKKAEHAIAACLILQEYLDSLERSC